MTTSPLDERRLFRAGLEAAAGLWQAGKLSQEQRDRLLALARGERIPVPAELSRPAAVPFAKSPAKPTAKAASNPVTKAPAQPAPSSAPTEAAGKISPERRRQLLEGSQLGREILAVEAAAERK